MDWMNYKEERESLYRAGFTWEDIERLVRFRRMYLMSEYEDDQAALDLSHLQFVRWLVEHGKLTEQLS